MGTLPVSKGGTGANNASQALANIGAAASIHKHNISDIEGLDSGGVSDALISQHNENPQAHSALFNAKAEKVHTHETDDITGPVSYTHLYSRLKSFRIGMSEGTPQGREGIRRQKLFRRRSIKLTFKKRYRDISMPILQRKIFGERLAMTTHTCPIP